MIMEDYQMKKFWSWKDSAEERILRIYGTIAPESWYDDDVTPAEFRKELMDGTGPVTLYLNSYGGDCIAASQIYSMLMEYPFDVTVKIDGIAASAASVIAMAGTKVLMAPTSCMMVHDPMTVAMGNTGDMQKAIEMLDTIKDSIVLAYQIKTGLDKKTLAKLMTEETWMSAAKAIELGFADGLLERETQDTVQAVLFSRKAVDTVFVNKLTERPVQSLYDRLEKLKNDAQAQKERNE